ncbi:hypothetical protein [Niabella drilacis]|uniref:DUF306 domain-containing protein n=1 Tax=Niabella drilacis (strain DSM 25811 / CCM 8410 / CCUG 62505 / LMG 26954 / E90) TaxID=1285928 RepID=A0A1G6V6P6_NIADE|nr:hypothetical protein [Niabella drilacis]SDD48667.1 hypothetical protein SAMN04487894_109195 [Niabella drilacis]
MKKQLRIGTISLLLFISAMLASCKKKDTSREQGAIAGDWILYTEHGAKIGTLSFRSNDSVYFNEGCCPQSGIYATVARDRYQILFAPRPCMAICLNWFATDAAVTVKLNGDEFRLFQEQPDLLLKGRRSSD